MSSILRYRSAILAALCVLGCSTDSQRQTVGPTVSTSADAAEPFELALRDFNTAAGNGAVSLFPAFTSLRRYYWLPSTAEAVISLGTNALPTLIRFNESDELRRAQLASACITIIKAKEISRGAPRKDPISGITVISYGVLR